jgi:hypothetical protein
VEFGDREKEKENDRTSVILYSIRCEGREIRMCIENTEK